MPTQRKHPQELRDRAARLVAEAMANGSEPALLATRGGGRSGG